MIPAPGAGAIDDMCHSTGQQARRCDAGNRRGTHVSPAKRLGSTAGPLFSAALPRAHERAHDAILEGPRQGSTRNADTGGVAERLKAPVLKTGMGASPRGFESLPLRHFRIKGFVPSVRSPERAMYPNCAGSVRIPGDQSLAFLDLGERDHHGPLRRDRRSAGGQAVGRLRRIRILHDRVPLEHDRAQVAGHPHGRGFPHAARTISAHSETKSNAMRSWTGLLVSQPRRGGPIEAARGEVGAPPDAIMPWLGRHLGVTHFWHARREDPVMMRVRAGTPMGNLTRRLPESAGRSRVEGYP